MNGERRGWDMRKNVKEKIEIGRGGRE